MSQYLFFDSASTTKCCDAAVELIQKYATEDFGNPSSNHIYGQKAAKAIRDARAFFARAFRVELDQVVFTGSGSESDNFAIYGVTTSRIEEATRELYARSAKEHSKDNPSEFESHPPFPPVYPFPPLQVISSSVEHPAVSRTIESLQAFGVTGRYVPIDSSGNLDESQYEKMLSPETYLISIQQVNNIMGATFPVERLAKLAKNKLPHVIFHTDAIQAFGKITVPQASSSVDLVSLSAHKIEGPKGVGALIILNRKLLKTGLRPLIWGGEQENGFRSGTQNAGLIAGFHAAAQIALKTQASRFEKVAQLNSQFRKLLEERLNCQMGRTQRVRWNSPENAVPHIVSLSILGFPAGPLSKLLEERGCLVSVGSACNSRKPEPDPVLSAIGLSLEMQRSTIRISLSSEMTVLDLETLVNALDDSIQRMSQLMGKPSTPPIERNSSS